MLRNSDQFMIAYNKIEQQLKDILETDDYIPFIRSVDKVVKKNLSPIVKRYRDDLVEFAELRNAIVHKSFDPNYAIAEPHDLVVKQIKQIEKELSEPKKVIPMFARSVHSFQTTDSLFDLLVVIRDKEYSKFPVYEENLFSGLVTKKGITNWLAKHVEERMLSLLDVSLLEILSSEGGAGSYQFIDRATSIYGAKEIFQDFLSHGKRLDAVLITENGDPNEHLLGIITPLDLVRIP